MAIVGKFVMVVDGDSYRTGKVEQQLNDDSFFVRFDHMSEKDINMPLALVQTMSIFNGISGEWMFFDTREELKKFLDWMES